MKRYNILAVDDDEEITGLLRIALQKHDMSVETAGTCETALRLLDQGFAADAILLDYFLPGIGGDHLAKELLKRGSPIPIVFFTAADTECLEKANYPNVVGIIKKPFELDDVGRVLQKACTVKLPKTAFPKSEIRPCFTESSAHGMPCEEALETINVMKLLLSTFSHAMKNSLQTISYYVELLEKGYIETDDMPGVYTGIKKKIHEFKTRLDHLKSPENAYGKTRFSPAECIQKAMQGLSDEAAPKQLVVNPLSAGKVPDQYGREDLLRSMLQDFLFYIFRSVSERSCVEITLAAETARYMIGISVCEANDNLRDKEKIFETSVEREEGMRLLRAFKCLLELEGKLEAQCVGNSVKYVLSFPMNNNVSF